MVMQIGFFMDETDEGAFFDEVTKEGALFMPSTYPEWPIPVIHPPLPLPTEPYMHSVTIWHPEIFRKDEMWLADHRPYNPAGRFYLSNLWPVLEVIRSNPAVQPMYQGALRLDAEYRSFRTGKSLTAFTEEEVSDFSKRCAELRRLYNRLCALIRRTYVKIDRAFFCGPSGKSTIPLPWLQERASQVIADSGDGT
jgi:hypothetical protein